MKTPTRKACAFAAALCAATLASAADAPDAPTPSPHDLHAAMCVAALEVNTEDLARQVKSGQEAQRALLLERIEDGTAFVGDVYLRGDSDEKRARALANQALETQKSLTPDELAARQLACAAEGRKLYSDSNAFERAVVTRLAKRRMAKLLGG